MAMRTASLKIEGSVYQGHIIIQRKDAPEWLSNTSESMTLWSDNRNEAQRFHYFPEAFAIAKSEGGEVYVIDDGNAVEKLANQP